MYPEEYGIDEKYKSNSHRCTTVRKSLTMLKMRDIAHI